MTELGARIPLPYFDSKEQEIIEEMKETGGDIFRMLRRR